MIVEYKYLKFQLIRKLSEIGIILAKKKIVIHHVFFEKSDYNKRINWIDKEKKKKINIS